MGHSQANKKLIGQLAIVGFLAATATELISGEGLLHTVGL